MLTGDAHFSGHPSPSHLGLAYMLYLLGLILFQACRNFPDFVLRKSSVLPRFYFACSAEKGVLSLFLALVLGSLLHMNTWFWVTRGNISIMNVFI